MNRRDLLAALASALVLPLIPGEAIAQPVRRAVRRTTRRVVRRTVRRRVRRRIRRRVVWRVVAGRRLLVVPVAVAVGWELMIDDSPHVVVAINTTSSGDTATVRAPDGSTKTVDIVREDTAENAVELEGSVLPDGDTTTPGRDDEIEEVIEEVVED